MSTVLSARAHRPVVLTEQAGSERDTDLAGWAGDVQVNWNRPPSLFQKGLPPKSDFDNNWWQALAAPQGELLCLSLFLAVRIQLLEFFQLCVYDCGVLTECLHLTNLITENFTLLKSFFVVVYLL